MAEKKCVMISSTARDLPEHRKEMMDACLWQKDLQAARELLDDVWGIR